MILILIWVTLLFVFLGVPGFHYLSTKRFSAKSWNLDIDQSFAPSVTILVPTHNEEKSIQFKLENLSKLEYSKEKTQIVLVNDCSTDNTLQEIAKFQNSNSNLDFQVINNTERLGKVKALNGALKHATGEIIVVSDADCFWPPDVLEKALPYLSDPSVGAITGLETLLNSEQSWITETELLYNDNVHIIRIGESKIHSTIFFQGGFGAYKRELLPNFDEAADDSGTALNIVQSQKRAILIPEVIYFTTFPCTWKGKITTKIRRARQLIQIWFRCLSLSLNRNLLLPKKIFVPEAFLYLVNPIVFMFLVFATIFMLLTNAYFLVAVGLLTSILLLKKKTRILFVETIQNNFVLLIAFFSVALNKRFDLWKTDEISRTCLTREILERHNLLRN